MLKKFFVTTLSIMAVSTSQVVFANDDSCEVQVAVSSPPIYIDTNIAFNVTNDNGFSKSITLQGGSAPKVINKIVCSPIPYTVSATQYSTPNNGIIKPIQAIGECTLKAGNVILNGSNNSVSVVFPNDFICNH